MGRRKRFQSRVLSLLAPDATRSASSSVIPPLLAQQTPPRLSPSAPSPTVSSGGAPVPTASRNLVLEKALVEYLQKLPATEKAAFAQASKIVDEQTLLSNVRAYDAAHRDSSSFRPHAERLSKFLNLLNRFMGGVAIGIQANPEVSALVVGAVRIVIDLALKFTTFFTRLADMVCTFEDYLGPLEEYAKSADIELVQNTVVNAYANVLDFGWKARCVFVDANGNQRRWTSPRTFMRQHWDTFESEFVSIKEDLQHHLDVLLHSVQALQFDAFQKAEQARQREEESRSPPFDGICVCLLLTVWQGRKGPHSSHGSRASTSRKPIRTLTRRSMNKLATG
jgi:hypothetical protein